MRLRARALLSFARDAGVLDRVVVATWSRRWPREIYRSLKRPSCAGYDVIRPSSTSAGVACQSRQERPGAWTRLTSGSAPVGLSLPGRWFLRQYRRLPAQFAAQRRLGQGVLPQSHTFSRPLTRDCHAGRLCRFPSSRSRTSTARQASRLEGATLVKILEQSDRARPSQCEVQAVRHAWTEALRLRHYNDSWRRAHAPHSQRPV